MAGPPNKWTDSVDLSGDSTPAEVLATLNTAWTAYFNTYQVYPSVWELIGTRMFYGGY